MKSRDFVKLYKEEAKLSESISGVPYKVILTQAAIESAWGEAAPGNMFFGVKDTDGINGNEQLITTTEYHDSMNYKYPVILSIKPEVVNGKKRFKYRVKAYFIKYKTAGASFLDHGQFLACNKRYRKAFEYTHEPVRFLEEVIKAGYATDHKYMDLAMKVYSRISQLCNE